MNKIVLSVCCLLAVISACGQSVLKPESRLEIQLKNGYTNEAIFQCSKGFFVIEAHADKNIKNKQEIRYDLYDRDLKQTGETSLYIPTDMRMLLTFTNDSCIYKMYANRKDVFLFCRVGIKDLMVDTVRGQLPKGISLNDMKVVGTKAWFQSKLRGKTCILQVDMKTGESRVSDFIEKKWSNKTSIVNYQMASQSGELLVFLNRYIKRGVCELSQMRVNGSCELCDTIRLTGTGDKLITSVSGCRTSETEMVYSGTYSRYDQNKAEGLFFAKSTVNKLDYINYLNFLDIKSFVDYQSGIEKAITKTIRSIFNKNGKDYGVNYNITTHDIITIPGGYLLVGELYQASYSSMANTYTTFVNGMAMTHTYYTQVFNGYRYTHAIVAAFNNDGILQWDQCFYMNSLNNTYTPHEHIRVSDKTDKQITLMYANGGVIVSKIIGFDGSMQKDINYDLIGTGNELEKTYGTVSNANYWYGNNFLVFGTQTVKNSEDKSRRKVFYVNKIGF